MTPSAESAGPDGPFASWAVVVLDVDPPPVEAVEVCDFARTHVERAAWSGDRVRHLRYQARKPVHDGEPVVYAGDPRVEQPTDHFVWDPAFASAFPALCRWIEALPFTVLHGFDLVTQTADIEPHLDVFGLNNSQTMFARNRALEPVFYRILFTGPDDDACRNRSFFVSREVDDPPTYVELPDGASVIALTSSVAYHGATDRPGRKTTGVLYGELDEQAHLDLLARSVARRPDHAIRFARSGPVEGPGAILPYGGAE